MSALSLLVLAAVAQDTVPPPGIVEQAYVVQSGSVELAGTLTLPRSLAGPVPVALIIAGSGPTDRNGNSPVGSGLRTNAYAQLAWRLAERGIASLRYDKRGLGGSHGGFDMARTTIDDFAGDARAAADTLARDRRFSGVCLVGHSEGATLAVRAANAGAPVRGVALLAGLGRPFVEVLHEQLGRQLDSATLVRYDTAMAHYLRGEDPEVPPFLRPLFVPVNRAFVQSLASYDAEREVAGVRQPLLIVQGGMDIQVSVYDAERLHEAKPAARLVVLPAANHVFKRAQARDLRSQQVLYTDPTIPIMPELVTALADWIVYSTDLRSAPLR